MPSPMHCSRESVIGNRQITRHKYKMRKRESCRVISGETGKIWQLAPSMTSVQQAVANHLSKTKRTSTAIDKAKTPIAFKLRPLFGPPYALLQTTRRTMLIWRGIRGWMKQRMRRPGKKLRGWMTQRPSAQPLQQHLRLQQSRADAAPLPHASIGASRRPRQTPTPAP